MEQKENEAKEQEGTTVPRRTLRVVAAVIEHEGKYFVTQRCKGEHAGKWEFPGGKIEPGETAEEALHREIREELEIEVGIERYLMTVEYDYPAFHLSMDCFLCHFGDGTPRLMAASAGEWVSGAEMQALQFLPADKGLVAMLGEREKD